MPAYGETTTSYAISVLYPDFLDRIVKVEGTFDGNGHFWCEVDNQIIDLSVEQFNCVFQFPVSIDRLKQYLPKKKIQVDKAIYKEAKYLSKISGFKL